MARPKHTPAPAPTPVVELTAVMAFSHPQFGAWARNETRTVPADEASEGLVRAGHLRPRVERPRAGALPRNAPQGAPAGHARVRALSAFSNPAVGTWARGDERTVPVDDTVTGLVRDGYLAVEQGTVDVSAVDATSPTGHLPDLAGTSRVRAVMAFSTPTLGTWTRNETRTMPVDAAVIAAVESGYLEPVWDDTPPQPATSGVSMASPTGMITVYPAHRGGGDDQGREAAFAALAAANPGRGPARLRPRGNQRLPQGR